MEIAVDDDDDDILGIRCSLERMVEKDLGM
jgi:hypothetical protein